MCCACLGHGCRLVKCYVVFDSKRKADGVNFSEAVNKYGGGTACNVLISRARDAWLVPVPLSVACVGVCGSRNFATHVVIVS